MKKMKIVIEISEEAYNCAKNGTFDANYSPYTLLDIIKSGTPLPDYHSDLIERDELLKQPMDTANYPSNYVRIAKTIIPATERSNNEEDID